MVSLRMAVKAGLAGPFLLLALPDAHAERTGHPGLPHYVCTLTDQASGKTSTFSVDFSSPRENDWVVLSDEYVNRLNISELPDPFPPGTIEKSETHIYKSGGRYVETIIYVGADDRPVSGFPPSVKTGQCYQVQ